jgi:predicted metal-dependent peptidase
MPAAGSFVERELIKGIVDLARHKEFYGHIVQQLDRIFVSPDHEIQTAAVGRVPGDRFIKMYLNRRFFGDLYEQHGKERGWIFMLGVLEHEIIHIVFGHLFLRFQDRIRGNVAKDLVVNGIIPNETLPGNYVIPEHYGFERGKSALWYYTHLQENPKFKQQCAEGAFGAEGVLSHIMSSHKMWTDVEDDLVAKEFAKDIVRKAKDLCCKSYGNIPGAVLEQIEDLLKKEKAIIPWGKVLRMFVASCAESVLDYTVKRISRRFDTRPGTRKGDVLRVAVAVDTSGSISDEQLKIFFNEIRWVWKNGAIMVVYEADCTVQAVYAFKGKFTGKVHGRGGTDLEPVLREVEGKYDALIYFTDFYAPHVSRQYKIPTLWVLHTGVTRDQYPAKWGRHIKITEGIAEAA